MEGTVKFFKPTVGYGFIVDNATNKEYFVHYSNIIMDGYKTLTPGQKVLFKVEISNVNNKEQATSVTPI